MGKRKKSSRAPTGPKKREPLATQFTCLFCNHEKAVTVKMDKKMGLGQLHCRVCGQRFQTGINYLSAAVDVYSDWIDACDEVAREAAEAEADDRKFSTYGTAGQASGTRTGGAGEDEDGGYEDE